MDPRDWLLLLLRPTEPESRSLDPIRIQKGMFYFARQASVANRQKYRFDPYYYGPCSFAIYHDLDSLVEEGLVETVGVEGQSWMRYRLTARGLSVANDLTEIAPPEALKVCEAARGKVISHTFRSLLKEVYTDYPEYAVKSIANLP